MESTPGKEAVKSVETTTKYLEKTWLTKQQQDLRELDPVLKEVLL